MTEMPVIGTTRRTTDGAENNGCVEDDIRASLNSASVDGSHNSTASSCVFTGLNAPAIDEEAANDCECADGAAAPVVTNEAP